MISNGFKTKHTNKIWRNSQKNPKGKKIFTKELVHKAELHITYIGMIERAKNITLINIKKLLLHLK